MYRGRSQSDMIDWDVVPGYMRFEEVFTVRNAVAGDRRLVGKGEREGGRRGRTV